MRIQKNECQIFDKLHVHTSLTKIFCSSPNPDLRPFPSVNQPRPPRPWYCYPVLQRSLRMSMDQAQQSEYLSEYWGCQRVFSDRSDLPISQTSEKLTCPLKTDGWKTIFLFEMVPFKGHDMFTMGWLHPPPTWRIILVSKWLVTMVIVSPLSRLAPLTKGLWLINGGSLTTCSRPGMTIQVGIRSPKWWSRWGIHQKFSKWTNKSSKVYAWSHL